MADSRVIIVGAGPTGLTAALFLVKAGVPVTVLESRTEIYDDPRAATFHPPTMEMFEDSGVTQRLHDLGIVCPKWQFRGRTEGVVAEFDLGLLAHVTRYPYRLQCEQHKLVAILADMLAKESGFTIHYGATVEDVKQCESGVTVVTADGSVHTGDYVIGADGGSLRRLTDEPSGDFLPSWSPDGKWIYFTSDRTGAMQLWKAPSAGGLAVQVTRGGARESWPSPDGKLLYFTRRGPAADIWTVPAEGGLEQPVPELAGFNRIARAWGVIQQGIYFISRQHGPRQEVRFFSFATRRVSSIAILEKEPTWNVPTLALSPDGRSMLTVQLDHAVNDLMLVENFH